MRDSDTHVMTINIDDKNPGPERYEIKPLIDGKGFNYVSKFKSSTSKSISGKPKDLSSKYTSNIL